MDHALNDKDKIFIKSVLGKLYVYVFEKGKDHKQCNRLIIIWPLYSKKIQVYYGYKLTENWKFLSNTKQNRKKTKKNLRLQLAFWVEVFFVHVPHKKQS